MSKARKRKTAQPSQAHWHFWRLSTGRDSWSIEPVGDQAFYDMKLWIARDRFRTAGIAAKSIAHDALTTYPGIKAYGDPHQALRASPDSYLQFRDRGENVIWQAFPCTGQCTKEFRRIERQVRELALRLLRRSLADATGEPAPPDSA